MEKLVQMNFLLRRRGKEEGEMMIGWTNKRAKKAIRR
jgi:hypothetical protein